MLLVHHRELGVGAALLDGQHREDGVPRCDGAHLGSHSHDDAREIAARDERQRKAHEAAELAAAQPPVGWVDAGRGDVQEGLSRARVGDGTSRGREDAGVAVAVEGDGVHGGHGAP